MDSLILNLAIFKTTFFSRIYSRQAVKDLLITCEYLLYLKAWSVFTLSRNVHIDTSTVQKHADSSGYYPNLSKHSHPCECTSLNTQR